MQMLFKWLLLFWAFDDSPLKYLRRDLNLLLAFIRPMRNVFCLRGRLETMLGGS